MLDLDPLPDDLPVFTGDETTTRVFLRNLPPGAVYTYLLLDAGRRPFYVGKGMRQRVLEHRLEAMRQSPLPTSNPFKCRVIRRLVDEGGDLSYAIDRVFTCEDAALDRESELIARYRRRCDGGVLTNLASGRGSTAARDPFSTQRHAATLSGINPDRPERTALNLFLSALGGVDSVPIKPMSEYRRLVPAYPSPKRLSTPSRRNALTLAAGALGAGLAFYPGVIIPRAFVYRPDPDDWPLETPPPAAVPAVIENGAISDILKLGLATLVPAAQPRDEGLHLSAEQICRLALLLGTDWLADLGLLPQEP